MCKSQGMQVNTELRRHQVCLAFVCLCSRLVGSFSVSGSASPLLKFLVHHFSSLLVPPPHFGGMGWVSVGSESEAGHTRGEYLGFLGTSVKDLRS